MSLMSDMSGIDFWIFVRDIGGVVFPIIPQRKNTTQHFTPKGLDKPAQGQRSATLGKEKHPYREREQIRKTH